jgi:hypothetical protein
MSNVEKRLEVIEQKLDKLLKQLATGGKDNNESVSTESTSYPFLQKKKELEHELRKQLFKQ